MSGIIKIHSLINGGATGFDGQWLVEYDPGRDGVEPISGQPMMAHIVTTPNRDAATEFEDPFETWKAIDPRCPTRPDGRPNRPLTAFTVEVEQK